MMVYDGDTHQRYDTLQWLRPDAQSASVSALVQSSATSASSAFAASTNRGVGITEEFCADQLDPHKHPDVLLAVHTVSYVKQLLH